MTPPLKSMWRRCGSYPLGRGLLLAVAATSVPKEAPSRAVLRILSNPPQAMVWLDRVAREPTPVTLQDLEPGDHLLVLRKVGFRELRKTVSLSANQRMALELSLEPVTGLVLIHSSPTGADVRIDGADRGKTPLLLHDLRLGAYRVQLGLPGYLSKELELHVKDEIPIRLQVELTPDSATLYVESVPPGAQVLLNGTERGKAPCTVDRVPEGSSQLRLVLDGYVPYDETIRLLAGDAQRVHAVLRPLPARLTVVSIPDRARIYVNNEFRGQAPVTIDGLEPGTYRVRAELPGHDPVARTIELRRGVSVTEEFRLESNTGELRITTEPAGVLVILDGQPAGTTQAKPGETDRVSEILKLEQILAGPHEIELVRKGYYPKRVRVEVERGKTRTFHETLVRRFIPDCEVRTATEVIRGILTEIDPQGNVKLEVRPGIFKTIPANEIKSRVPIREAVENQ